MTQQKYYPPANTTAQRFDDDYPGTIFTYPLKRNVWHSTEGNGWPGYDGGAKAPTLTVMADLVARKTLWRQHFPTYMSSRALRNEDGGVQTNKDECVQVEVVGTCDPARHASSPSWLYLPEAPGWFLDDLADYAAWLEVEWGIPVDGMPTWQAYPASYGNTNNRMTDSEWNGFRGHCGHQHVPENDHGDPGAFDVPGILARAAAILDSSTGVDMALPALFVAINQQVQYYVDGNVKRKVVSGDVSDFLRHTVGLELYTNVPTAVLNLWPTVATDANGVGSDAAQQCLTQLSAIAAQLSAIATSTSDDATAGQVQAVADAVAALAVAGADDATSDEVAEVLAAVEALGTPPTP